MYIKGGKMKVNVCGILHDVVEVETNLGNDGSLGLITYAKAMIEVNKDQSEECKIETLIHEMVHGMLVHIGREDLSNDETFVQSMANAIYQGFEIKEF